MTIYRETLRTRRTIAYTPNTITVDPSTAWYLRFHYRSLRRDGASDFTARSALYNILFQTTMNRPVFTSGNAA